MKVCKNRIMKKPFLLMLLILLVVLLNTNSHALIEAPRDDSLFYYKIGGGRHISIPPSLTITTINLSTSASFSNLNCGLFDPVASIEASLDNLKMVLIMRLTH